MNINNLAHALCRCPESRKRILRCAAFLIAAGALAAAIFPRPAFGIDSRLLLEKLQGPVPSLDVPRLQKSLSDEVSRTLKSGYEYVLWDVAKGSSIKSLDENALLACALVLACTSPSSTPIVKIDVVRITQQDAYGKPRWDTAQRLGHFEIPTDRCQKITSSTESLSLEEMRSIPSQAKVQL